MNNRGYSAYNLARGVLLNSRLTLADSGNQPLKLLDIVISGMGMDSTSGLWLTPLHTIPAVPRVFPFDIIYLDQEYRVLDTAEMGPGIEFPAFHPEVASALILPPNTLNLTKTETNDRLIVCVSSDLEALLAAASLPAPETTEPCEEPVASGAVPSAGPAALTASNPVQETPLFTRSSPVPDFEHSVLTAVAKVAEARSVVEPKELISRQGSNEPEPSFAASGLIRDSYREVQPAIIEHRIDPEDLFSNWVVSAPPAPQKGRIAPPEPPPALKSETTAQESLPEALRHNGRKSNTPKTAADSPAKTRAASASSIPPKARPAAKPLASDEKPAIADEPNSSAPARADVQAKANTPAPPATTFTAVPYGMWQVSMPTAVAPMTGAKSPTPAKRLDSPGLETESTTRVKPAAPAVSATSEERQSATPPATERYVPTAPPGSPTKSPARAESSAADSAYKPDAFDAMPPKPVLRDSASTEVHRPGDFVASLQEKLQRAQHSRPSPPPPAEEQLPAASAPQEHAAPAKAAAPAHPISPALDPQPKQPVAKTKVEPAMGSLRSKLRHWLNSGSSPSDRRRSIRRYVPGMVAHYFTGGAPKPKDVADISMSGMYLLTDDRWMPGTMIQMTLQKPCSLGEKKQSINVLSRIIRRGSDGVAVEFVMPEALSHISHDIQPSQATDKIALARFL